MILVLETVVFHILIAQWSATIAWIFTASSAYAVVFLWAQHNAAKNRKVIIDENGLSVRCGLTGDVHISFPEILLVRKKQSFTEPKDMLKLNFMQGYNLVIEVKSTHRVLGMYGIKRPFNVLGFYLDDPDFFIEKLRARLSSE